MRRERKKMNGLNNGIGNVCNEEKEMVKKLSIEKVLQINHLLSGSLLFTDMFQFICIKKMSEAMYQRHGDGNMCEHFHLSLLRKSKFLNE